MLPLLRDASVYITHAIAEAEVRQEETRKRRAMYEHEMWLDAGDRVEVIDKAPNGEVAHRRMGRVKYTTALNGETVLAVFPEGAPQ